MTNSGSPVKGQLGRLSQAQAGDRGQTSRGSGFPEGLLRAPEVLGTLRTPWEGEWPTAYNMCVLLEIRRCLLTGPFFKLEPSWINKASKSENLHFSQIQPDFHWRPCCGFKTRLESSPKLQGTGARLPNNWVYLRGSEGKARAEALGPLQRWVVCVRHRLASGLPDIKIKVTISSASDCIQVAQHWRIQLQCKRCRRCGFDPWVGKTPWRKK